MDKASENPIKRPNDVVVQETILPHKRLKTVSEAFRDTNFGKPLQVGRLSLRAHILEKSKELRSLEALASNLEDPRAEIRIEVVSCGRKPLLVAVKKEKASLSDGNVPFDEVRLVLNANGAYHLFIYHAVLVRSGTVDITQRNQLRSLMKEVIESRPCVGVDCEVIDKLGYLSVEVEEHKHP